MTHIHVQLSRRRFLAMAGAGAAALGSGGVLGITAASKGGSKGSTAANRLYLPGVVSPSALTLTARETTWPTGSTSTSRVWSFNGAVPGPTIHVTSGSTASITFANRLAHPNIVHWHGLEVDQRNDGGPHLAVAGGRDYAYSFPVAQRASMSWYHPHPHMHTAEQAYMGLYGAFIIRDNEEASLKLPGGDYELPLVVCDAILDSAGNLLYKPSSSGLQGKVPLVNGTLDPFHEVKPAVYRLRILNGANARVFRLALSAGTFTIIGNDGGLLPRADHEVTEIELSPAERVDVLVDLRTQAGKSVQLLCRASGWRLLDLRVANSTPVANMPALGSSLSNVPALVAPSTVTRSFGFDGMSRINGKVYDMHRMDFEVPAGTVERWRFTTGGNAPHPVHVHGTHFQVISRTGGRNRLFGWEDGWKDTVLLNKSETVDIAVKFDAKFRGSEYLLHCHQLQHEDAGMMANFKVV
jgi:blue copper oxidase